MEIARVRSLFIDYFKQKSHQFVPSSSIIPIGDQTILFTIAGMTQFKSALTGEEIRPYKRATNYQKCVRIGDLDDVGKDGRHLTMFEMLGSWSFGDYYKNEAIAWAYDLAIRVFGFDVQKVWATVHHSDSESLAIWKTTGIHHSQIRTLGDKDNFWSMGPTGPCGPCSELYFDQGAAVGKCDVPNFDCKAGPGCDCDRYLEFWNLVFMQFDKQADGSLKELPFKSVDTGAGLERVTALLQNKSNCFEIDIFVTLKNEIKKVLKLAQDEPISNVQNESLNVIADHIRTLTFSVADGAHFGTEGRGYVLRRVLRRAVHHVNKLNPKLARQGNILAQLVPSVVSLFKTAFPDLPEHMDRVASLICSEESRFINTLEAGLEKFQALAQGAETQKRKILTGAEVFILHDSFGFPSDLTRVLCDERGLTANLEEFEKLMTEQRSRGRAEAKFYKQDKDDSAWLELYPANQDMEKVFSGYELSAGTIKTLTVGSENKTENMEFYSLILPPSSLKRVRQLKSGNFEFVLENTPFYPEGGGQLSDKGMIRLSGSDGKDYDFEIIDVQRLPSAIIHQVKATHFPNFKPVDAIALESWFPSCFSGIEQVHALVDVDWRQGLQRNHTATHLLHEALRKICGDNVRQAGSLVQSHGLRFDFSMSRALTAEELNLVESLVNKEIFKSIPVKSHQSVPLEDAKKMGAIAIFDEKYGDTVRVLEIPGFSIELCGGCHVSRTSEIGLFKILSETSVTSGVRRIWAITGPTVLFTLKEYESHIQSVCTSLKTVPTEMTLRIDGLKDKVKDLEKQRSSLQSQLINFNIDFWISEAYQLREDLAFVCRVIPASDLSVLELAADRLRDKGVGVILLGADIDGRAHVLASINPTVLKSFPQLNAGSLVKKCSEELGGKGGGRADFAKGSGPNLFELEPKFGFDGEFSKYVTSIDFH